jgi:hypothetical protein
VLVGGDIMRDKIGKILSKILSRKHDAKIKIRFKEKEECQKDKTK